MSLHSLLKMLFEKNANLQTLQVTRDGLELKEHRRRIKTEEKAKVVASA